MEKPKKSIVIVGGSLAGLMSGIALKRLGHNVHILEADPSNIRSSQAAGIRAGPAMQEFLQKHDRTNLPWAISCPGLQFIDKQNKVVRVVEFPMQMTGWSTLYYRLRANFDGFENGYVGEVPKRGAGDGDAVYDYGKRVRDVSLVGEDVEVKFEDVRERGEDRKDVQILTPDLVIAADGAGSNIRGKVLRDDVQRPYSGYVAWRGSVIEREVSQETRDIIGTRFTVFKMKRNYILVYIIPGENGTLEPNHRLLNFVWYYNVPSQSQEYADLMTDSTGHRHHFTIPPGKMQESVWTKQVQYAKTVMPSPFIELITKTSSPFVTAVTETQMSRATFLPSPTTKQPKLLILGDALSQFRPHLALMCNQAALQASLLEKVMQGDLSFGAWERQVLQYGNATRLLSKIAGTFAQQGGLQVGMAAMQYGWCLVFNWLVNTFWPVASRGGKLLSSESRINDQKGSSTSRVDE